VTFRAYTVSQSRDNDGIKISIYAIVSEVKQSHSTSHTVHGFVLTNVQFKARIKRYLRLVVMFLWECNSLNQEKRELE